MKLEISIKTSHQAKQHLLAGLADLLSGHYIKETSTWHNDNHFDLNFFFEADSPEIFLQNLSAAASKIENSFPQKLDIAVQVKNIAGYLNQPSVLKRTTSLFLLLKVFALSLG